MVQLVFLAPKSISPHYKLLAITEIVQSGIYHMCMYLDDHQIAYKLFAYTTVTWSLSPVVVIGRYPPLVAEPVSANHKIMELFNSA